MTGMFQQDCSIKQNCHETEHIKFINMSKAVYTYSNLKG